MRLFIGAELHYKAGTALSLGAVTGEEVLLDQYIVVSVGAWFYGIRELERLLLQENVDIPARFSVKLLILNGAFNWPDSCFDAM